MDRLTAERMFVAVIETGSFTAAAQRMGTQSGQASKLISRLEADLGVRLLNRTTRAVAPTEAGRAYYDRLRGLIDEFDGLTDSLRDGAQHPRGLLRIAAPMSMGQLVLAPALADFAIRYPDIALDVQFADRFASLVDEGFDLAIRAGRPAESSLIARRIGSFRMVTLAAPAYLGPRGVPVQPADLTQHDCIIDSNFPDPLRWPYRDADGAALTVPVAGRLRLSDAGACLIAAERGLGIACTPEFVALPALARGRVVQMLDAFTPEPQPISVLYPAGRHVPLKMRLLIEELAARFAGGLSKVMPTDSISE